VLNVFLVGGFKHGFYAIHNIWDNPKPIDELIFFRGVETTNQILFILLLEKVNIKVTMKKYRYNMI